MALFIVWRKDMEWKVLRDKRLWLLLGGALLLSLPGVLLLSLLLKPVPWKELRVSFVANDFMALYVIAVALMAIGVAWA
ncbi:MAG: hypothetical protein GWN18_01295 [Thermoplasmata archaeon]|nr:hypothetical protein [Thermoplasmata archaeon]NIV77393.1 hypothetical protein [Thermoplasmata archaeon]NIW81223.1 hypothetical protein [Thermoplasmata archaeon]NIW87439.1 hypothetical protein [Thermoplasmata archaeon]